MFNRALYYPWIEIQDISWLKTSALYWNQISTIVPESMGQPYLNYDSQLLVDEGILKPIRVNSRNTSEALIRNDVINYFDKYKSYYSRLLSQQNNRRNTSTIYWEKIDSQLYELIQNNMRYNNDYVMADKYFGDFYMTLLANRISKSKGLSLITDEPIINRVGVDLKNENSLELLGQYTPYRISYDRSYITKIVESTLADITLRNVGVSGDTDMKKIVKFKNKFGDYIARYRNVVQLLVNTLRDNDYETVEAFKSSLDKIVQDTIVPSLNDLKKSLEDERIKTLIAPISITGAIGLGTSMIMNPGVTIGTSAVCITAQAYLSKRRINAILRDSEYAFLQLVENRL